MRTAKATDYWRKVKKKTYQHFFHEIKLEGLNGFDEIGLNGGIFAFCGLNGAGKSTILASIKDLLGIPKTVQDQVKLSGKQFSGIFEINNTQSVCENKEGRRVTDLGLSEDHIQFIDFSKSLRSIEFFQSQMHLDELLEQYEDNPLDLQAIRDLSYLVGKQYSAASIIEIEDELTEDSNIPFFKVSVQDAEYDSTNMGTGEHYLFYIYWVLKDIPPHSVIIFEEPETGLNIKAQIHLMNYIASIVAEKAVTIILSTHSPFILDRIDYINIRLISRFGNTVSVSQPSSNISVNTLLGLEEKIFGTFLVEDHVAKLFLTNILEDYEPALLRAYKIDAVNGEGNISYYMRGPQLHNTSYRLIGVYDGDQEGIITPQYAEDKNFTSPFCFLPIANAIEVEIQEYLNDAQKLRFFCKKISCVPENIIPFLSKLNGEDHHDWFIDLCREIQIGDQLMVRAFYQLWASDHKKALRTFIKNLHTAIN